MRVRYRISLVVVIWVVGFYVFVINNPPTQTKFEVNTSRNSFINSSIELYFSPNGGAEKRLIEIISKETIAIRVGAYSFTEKLIADALVKAHKRGIDVQLVLDCKSNLGKRSQSNYVSGSGVPVYLCSKYPIYHEKVLVAVGQRILTLGSRNFSDGAEYRNREILAVIPNAEHLVGLYLIEWEKDKVDSRKLMVRKNDFEQMLLDLRFEPEEIDLIVNDMGKN